MATFQTMGRIAAFVQSHPGLMELLGNFPKLRPETGKMLLEYLERALREEDPESYIVASLRAAMDIPKKVRTVAVSQSGSKRPKEVR